MSAEELLQTSERSALDNNQRITHVSGNFGEKTRFSFKNHKSLGAVGFVTLILLGLIVFVASGSLVPAAISEHLVEATDVQYADAVESKILVFQQALESGNIPANTVTRLEGQGVKVEGSNLVFDGETIPAADFVNKVHSNASLYKAFNAATYDRAAYYYDESAEKVFRKIGTNRDNYTKESNFDDVMDGLVGEGSNININNASKVKKTDDNGNEYIDYAVWGEVASSKDASADEFVRKVANSNIAADNLTATLNATDALNTADTISKEQKSSVFFAGIMENISKMKAGQGNNAKINEAMNFLYKETESSVVDVNTGEIVTVKGSAMESPSLYAVLSGSKIDGSKVTNYASDRVLKTVENRTGVTAVSSDTKENNITSTTNKVRGTIGRLLPEVGVAADEATLSVVAPTIDSSLMNNSFESIGGVYAGELLVEGAVNVGKGLAKASGAAAGDAAAAQSYARLSDTVLALDAEADRINRSPLDISSPNTFLGSIVHKLGVSLYRGGTSGGLPQVFQTLATMMNGSSVDNVMADDASDNYLANFGNCETLGTVGAVGSVTCSEVATFDTSTLNDTFHDAQFIAFVEENTTLNADGTRTINKESKLADYIKYNNERITPVGVMDGGILRAIDGNNTSIPFVSDIVAMLKAFLGADDDDKAMATGRAFVNSNTNPDWQTYKYAQRYVSLARATDALRQYDGDETAYTNLQFFEGKENPVVAFLNDYYNEIANH